MKVTSVDDVALQTISALVHGDSGIGKTTSLKTLPPEKTILAVSERSLIPLRGMKFLSVLQLETWDDTRELYAAFNRDNETILQCKVLAIDSLSEISDMCVRHIVHVDRKRLVSSRTGGKSDVPQGIYEEQMGMEDWGLYRTRMTNFISALTHLPVHVIMTCLSAWSKDKDGGDTLRTPNLSGKVSRECAAHFDLVLYMEARKDTDGNPARVWRTFNDGRSIAKDASGKLDPYEETNWTKLYAKILNGGTKNESR